MSELHPAIANALFYASCLREARAFRRSLGNVAETQERLLRTTLARNAQSEYGRIYGFDGIGSMEEYRARVPLTDYEDYAPFIERIGAGEPNVLTGERVTLLEPTSGSSSATKSIPYTPALKAEFARGVAAWLSDVFRSDPRSMLGPAYWSISPAAHAKYRTLGGVPVGFEDDAEYLGRGHCALTRSVMAVPSEVRLIEDLDLFRYVTLLSLLRARSLALISVWNPTFLTILPNKLPDWRERLSHDIANGTLPLAIPTDIRERLAAGMQPKPRRAKEVRQAFASEDDAGGVHARLWPRLRQLSCWTEAHAALHVPEAASLPPQARVVGKGLVSTECFVSLPLADREGAVLSLRSHFYEFLREDDSDTLLAHKLTLGEYYEVVVTTGGGLYRYRTGDMVQVVGHEKRCPLLRFVGRIDLVSDRFGEKLNERHVREALEGTLLRHAPSTTFAMLAYEEARNSYALFVEAADIPERRLHCLSREVASALRENFNYDYCRRLGQLRELSLFRIQAQANQTCAEACRESGQRAGDIKPVALHREEGWSQRFVGGFRSGC